MISRQLIVLLVLLLSTSSQALKGTRGRTRQLQKDDIFDKSGKEDGKEKDTKEKDGKEKEGKEDKTGKSDKSDKDDKKGKEKEDKKTDKEKGKKSDKKDDKKSDKKNKKGCKKRPKTSKGSKVTDEDGTAPRAPLDVTDEEEKVDKKGEDKKTADKKKSEDEESMLTKEAEEEDMPWCEEESIQKKGNCAELRGGKLPESDVVTGSLALEITSKKENAVEEMERKLKEDTSLSAVGCGGRRLQENVTGANITEIFLLAIDIAGLSEQTENCTSIDDTNGTICTVMTSKVKIHYAGNATTDQKVALFDSLTNTILAQVEGGEFDDIASVHFAEARIAGDETGDEDPFNSSKESDEGSSSGMIGGVLAAVAVVAAVGGVYAYKKKQSADGDGCGPAGVAPAGRPVVAVLSNDVEIVNATVF